MDAVSLTTNGPISTITLARGDGRNALDEEMLHGIGDVVSAAVSGEGPRVVVVATAEPNFSVGGDVAMFSRAGARAYDLLHAVGGSVTTAARLLHESDVITIAAVRGAVGGGAVGFMLACDIVLAADSSTFGLGYSQLGTTPDAGTSWFLARDAGYRRALQLFLTNERLDAARALELGMVNEVVGDDALDDRVGQVAALVAAGPQRALREGKRLFRAAANSQLAAQLEDEIATFANNTREADFTEGVAAFMEKRRPVFGRG